MTKARRRATHYAGGALALLAIAFQAGAARADTATTGYSLPGNQMDPAALQPELAYDPSGLSVFDEITRSPTGLLYPLPLLYPQMTQSKTNPDWWSSGWIEGGVLGSLGPDKKSAALNEYGGWHDGPAATSLGFLAENRKSALYVSGLAEDIARDDQFYQLKIGRYGIFDLTGYFDSIPHLYSTTARSIWTGVGTNRLTLRNGLTPGGSTAAEVSGAAAIAAPTRLQVMRQKAGMTFSYTPTRKIEAALQLSNEWRDGTRPVSATFGYPFENGATQIAEPVHYRTFDVTALARYKGNKVQANFTYAGSVFLDQDRSLTWDNPGLTSNAPGAFIPAQGLLSLPPSNSYNSLKTDFAALISPRIRFAASMSYNMMRQNDTLLPPTISTGMIDGISAPIDLNEWNTTAALSRLRAGAAIDQFNAFAQLHIGVTSRLAFDFEVRDHTENNLTNYVAFNPQTGQYGYIAIDGGLAPFIPSLSGVYEPSAPGSLVQIRNMPFENGTLKTTVSGAYRFGGHMKLALSYELDQISHSVREVADANDNTVRLQFDANGYPWGSVRVSYQFARLTGSDYTSNPYTPYYSASLPGYIPATPAGDPAFALSDLRKFDIANRDEHKIHAQTNYILSPRIDLQIMGDLKLDDYDAAYGLRSTSNYDLNADIDYQMSLSTTLTGYFSFESNRRDAANINPTGAGTSGAAGSPGYPLQNAWYETLGESDYSAGFNARHSWQKVTLTADYHFTYAVSPLTYTYATTGAFFGLVTAAQAGNSFPDITFDAHTFDANLVWQFAPRLSCRFFYRFDYETVRDFHYANLQPVIDNNIYLGVRPENFTVQTVGVFFKQSF